MPKLNWKLIGLLVLLVGVILIILWPSPAKAQTTADAEPIKIGGEGYQCLGNEPLRWKTEGSATAEIPVGYVVTSVLVKAGQNCVTVWPENDPCYAVEFQGQILTVTKVGSGPECKDISHLEGTGSSPSAITGMTVTSSNLDEGGILGYVALGFGLLLFITGIILAFFRR